MIEVLQPGAATSLQGARAWRKAHLGIPLGGPADEYSHASANRIAGNPADAVALEITLLGPALRFRNEATVALCGAPFEANIPLWQRVRVEAGQTIHIKGTPRGARCYLAIAGGFAPDGVLRKGSQLQRAGCPTAAPEERRPRLAFDGNEAVLRYTGPEPHAGLTYEVTNEANRRGIRLTGPALPAGREMITEGVNAGTIQVPPNGQPLILFYDQTTTGGYPRLGTVLRTDLDRVGQLRPRDRVRLHWVPLEEAVRQARA